MKTFQLTVSEKQLKVIVKATELLGRIGMGQFVEILDNFNTEEFPIKQIHSWENRIRSINKEIFGSEYAHHGICSDKVPDSARTAIDICALIKFATKTENDTKLGRIWAFDPILTNQENSNIKIEEM